jgi:hypothetical protein
LPHLGIREVNHTLSDVEKLSTGSPREHRVDAAQETDASEYSGLKFSVPYLFLDSLNSCKHSRLITGASELKSKLLPQ